MTQQGSDTGRDGGGPRLRVGVPRETLAGERRVAISPNVIGAITKAGAAVVIPDAELDGPRLAREVGGLLAAPQRMSAMASAAREVAKPDAAEVVAREVLRLVANGGQ